MDDVKKKKKHIFHIVYNGFQLKFRLVHNVIWCYKKPNNYNTFLDITLKCYKIFYVSTHYAIGERVHFEKSNNNTIANLNKHLKL